MGGSESKAIAAVKRGALEDLELLGEDAAAGVDGNGCTPLILACHYAHEPLALELLRRGADATAANEQGCTALLHACVEGLPALTEELLLQPAVLPAPAPAPVYSRHTDETAPRTPLLAAAESGFAHGVRLLLRRGVRADEPVHERGEQRQELLVELLELAAADRFEERTEQ